jgi:hypothetical protein
VIVPRTYLWKSFLVALAFLITASTGRPAKEPSWNVGGTVTDGRGEPLSRAVVQLKNLSSLLITSCVTDREGQYHFNELQSNADHEISAHFRTKWSKVEYLSRFDAKPNEVKNLVVR